MTRNLDGTNDYLSLSADSNFDNFLRFTLSALLEIEEPSATFAFTTNGGSTGMKRKTIKKIKTNG